MGPFAQVNCRAVNAVFSGVMWIVPFVLVFIIAAHAMMKTAGAHTHLLPNRYVR